MRKIFLFLLLPIIIISCKNEEKYNEDILRELEKLNYVNDSVYRHSFIDSSGIDIDNLDSMGKRVDSIMLKLDSGMKEFNKMNKKN